MCFELELATASTPHLNRTVVILENPDARVPKKRQEKLQTDRKKRVSLKRSAIATYSPSLEESVVHFCVLEIHWMAAPPRITAPPDTDVGLVSLGA